MQNSSGILRVALTSRVCTHYRIPLLDALYRHPRIDLTVLHGHDVPGTKLANATGPYLFERKTRPTIARSGWPVPIHPTIAFDLWRLRPDVVLSEGGSNALSNLLVLAYCTVTRTPMVWWTLGELAEDRRRSLLQRLFRRLARWEEGKAAAFVAYSSRALSYLRDRGMADAACFLAVNTIDSGRILDSPVPEKDVADHRRRLGLGDRNVVLFVGALTHPKRLDRLLRAFASIEPGDHTALVIVGDGPVRSELELLARQLDLDSQVRFVGRAIESVASYFALGDLFVLPGLGGLAISEALSYGLPVLCSRADGTEIDLVIDGETGFRIDSDDDEAVERFLAKGIQELLDDDDLRHRLADGAQLHMRTHHSTERLAESLVQAVTYASMSR